MAPATLTNGEEVYVFYQPANPPDSSYDAPLMGSGNTGETGFATVSLDTSMVSDPADIGDGSQNAFNVEIAVFYPDGSGAETDAILTLGATTAVSLSPNDTWTPNPTGVPSLTNTYLAKASNYVPVLAENSGTRDERPLHIHPYDGDRPPDLGPGRRLPYRLQPLVGGILH